jgi:hypothetical protein
MIQSRAALSAAVLAVLATTVRVAAADAPPPVVVELFTAQGCRSCPPADAYLAELAKRDDVLALGFHVDYWNYIGWTDPLAFAAATDRQRAYRHRLNLPYIYTPEIIVGGAAEGVGSDRSAIDRLIDEAEAHRPPHPDLRVAWRPDGGLDVRVGAGKAADPRTSGEPATLWLIGYDRPRTTPIQQGENAGKLLTDYQPVRSVQAIGSWDGKAMELGVSQEECAAAGGGGVAVLLQSGGDGPILTAAKLDTAVPASGP